MRKTRVLAALLCLMMIATAIPMMQASANTTYTEADVLACLEAGKSITFADYAGTPAYNLDTLKAVPGVGLLSLGNTKGYTTSNAGPLVASELTYGANGYAMYGGGGARTQVWLLSADKNLQISAGSDWTPGSKNVISGTSTASVGKVTLDAYGVGTGATQIDVALVNDASTGFIDLNGNTNADDIVFDVAGITVGNNAKVAYAMTPEVYYNFVVKAEGSRYALYVKADSATEYTKIATFAADLDAADKISLMVKEPASVAAVHYKDAESKEYWLKATDAAPEGATKVKDLTAYPVMSSIYVKDVKTYNYNTALDSNFLNVMDGATLTREVNFADYYTSQNYTPAAGPMAGTELAPHTGAGLYKLYEAQGGYSIVAGQINAVTSNSGPFVRNLVYDANLGYELTADTRQNIVDMTSKGLAMRLGAKPSSMRDDTGIGSTTVAGVNGWEWNQSNIESGKVDVNMGYAGAVKLTVKFNQALASRIMVKIGDGANGDDASSIDNASGFEVGTAGFSAKNANDWVAYSNPTIQEGVWYDIVVKNNYNRYTIYIREKDYGAFTKVASYATKTTAVNNNKVLAIRTAWGTAPSIATKIVKFNNGNATYKYGNGNLGQYKAEDVPANLAAGDTFKGKTVLSVTDGANVPAYGETIIGSLATYVDSANSGLTLTEILGANYAKVNQVVFNADTKDLFNAKGTAAYWSGSYTGTADDNGLTVAANGTTIPNWYTDGAVQDGIIGNGEAFEFTYTGNDTPGKFVVRLSMADDTEGHRLYFDVTGNTGNLNIGGASATNMRDITAKRTLLVVRESDTVLKWYVKVNNGGYLYLGDTGLKTGSYNHFKNEGTGTIVLNSMAKYTKNGIADADTLPANASALRKYVDEDFEDLNELNYQQYTNNDKTVPADLLKAENGKVMIAVPTRDNSNPGRCNYLGAKNIWIPANGYAEINGYSTNRGTSFTFRNGAKIIYFSLAANANGITQRLTFAPGVTYDIRIVNNNDETFMVYAKAAGETRWNPVWTEAKAIGNNSSSPWMQIGGQDFVGDSASNALYDRTYMDHLSIYGPNVEKTMLVVDGNQSLRLPAEGEVMQHLAKVILQPANVDRTLIFAGYKGDQLYKAEMVPVPAGTEEVVVTAPTTMRAGAVTNTKIFLWDNVDAMTSVAPVQSFAK